MTTAEIFAQDKMMQLLGAELVHCEPGHFVIEMEVTEQHVQQHQTCHGGAIFALADAAFGIAANNEGRPAVSQHCSINYLRPAPLGQRIRAESVRRSTSGRTDIFDVRVTDREGEVIAELRGTARILKPR